MTTRNFTLTNHNTFGGIIAGYDFCTDYPRRDKTPSVVNRIARDFAFDKQCEKDMENNIKKYREKKTKNIL